MSHQHDHACPLAHTLNIVGDRWTLIVVREAFYGVSRFSEFQGNTGIAKNLLADRLNRLVAEDILARVPISGSSNRFAYELTDKGRSLKTILVALYQWGNEHIYGRGAEPVVLVDRKNRKPIKTLQLQDSKGKVLAENDIVPYPGPGADRHVIKRLSEMNQIVD